MITYQKRLLLPSIMSTNVSLKRDSMKLSLSLGPLLSLQSFKDYNSERFILFYSLSFTGKYSARSLFRPSEWISSVMRIEGWPSPRKDSREGLSSVWINTKYLPSVKLHSKKR